MAYTKEEWQKAKVLRESGKSLSEVELLTGINKSSIQRKEKKENWQLNKTQQLKSDIIEVEKENAKILEAAIRDLEIIAGQKAVTTKAKKSVANFKLREGMNIGCKVTLRADKMYEFLDRFFNISLPRVRDFRGINPNGFDGRGNYSVGIKEQLIFPEIDYDKIDKIRGMDINIVTTAQTDEEARELLKLMGAPFRS